MKKLNLLLVSGLIVSLNVNAQYALPVTWENADETASWTPFANAGDAPENFVIIDNPDMAGINTSEKCLSYTVLPAADPWVGAWSTAYGVMEFTDEQHIMQMMVYKDVISDCALKVEGGGADPVELRVPNTLIGEWELLSFDLSASIGIIRETLVFFPDFPDPRTVGSLCYVDNIGWEGTGTEIKELNKINVNFYPNPASKFLNVKSENVIASINIYDLAGKALLSFEEIGNKYSQLNIHNLKSGLYIVTVKDNRGNSTSKKVQIN